MEYGNQKLSIEEAKEVDMVNYLSALGYMPTKIKNYDYWYFSPLRNEKTPSFKVNRKLNRWYDHGIGKGGNIISFGILFYKCTVHEFLQKINNSFSFHVPDTYTSNHGKHQPVITILNEYDIRSIALVKYLAHRKIPLDIANSYCREIRYELYGKIYYGIGFKNDAGGYEIRNPYFKASSSPKDITTFNNNGKDVAVFEGFMDFLSFMTIQQKSTITGIDYVVLNSLSFFNRARGFMEKHETIKLYLDQDNAGQNCSRQALSLNKKYSDENALYNGYKDLNDWLRNRL